MKYFYIGCVITFSYFATIFAEETIVNPQQAQSLQVDLRLEPAYLREEIVELNHQLEALKQQSEAYTEQNKILEAKIENYKRQEEYSENALYKINFLRQVILSSPFSEYLLKDNDYQEAIVSIVYGDLSGAENYLNLFLTKNIRLEEKLSDADAVEGGFAEKINALQLDLQLSIDEANFLLGYVKLLLFKPSQSVEYFAKSYVSTKNVNLVFLNLIGLVDAFYAVGRTAEACNSAKNFDSALTQLIAKRAQTPIFLNESIKKRIRDIQKEFNCNQ